MYGWPPTQLSAADTSRLGEPGRGGCETHLSDDKIPLVGLLWGLLALTLVIEMGLLHTDWNILPVTHSLAILPPGTQCWDAGGWTTDHPAAVFPCDFYLLLEKSLSLSVPHGPHVSSGDRGRACLPGLWNE